MLAAQIQQGAPADVFASANTALPQQLYGEGLVEKPVVFTRNALILIVPKSNPAHIRSVYDLTRDGVKLVVAAPGVPVGDYTRTVLHNLGLDAALANVVSHETDVREVLAKVALGEADAGFVYTTDARTVQARSRRSASAGARSRSWRTRSRSSPRATTRRPHAPSSRGYCG